MPSHRVPHPGLTVWLTGLPSAGKTTLARAVEARLAVSGHEVEVLDGDEVRAVLSTELGWSRADRDVNVARIGWVAQRLAAHGTVVLAAVVSPYAAARDAVAAAHRHAGVRFAEVHVATPAGVCAARDVKGLYARQRAGTLNGVTGADGEYETPSAPALRVATSGSVTESADRVLALVDRVLREATADSDATADTDASEEPAL